jgi:hypothetical protein
MLGANLVMHDKSHVVINIMIAYDKIIYSAINILEVPNTLNNY